MRWRSWFIRPGEERSGFLWWPRKDELLGEWRWLERATWRESVVSNPVLGSYRIVEEWLDA